MYVEQFTNVSCMQTNSFGKKSPTATKLFLFVFKQVKILYKTILSIYQSSRSDNQRKMTDTVWKILNRMHGQLYIVHIENMPVSFSLLFPETHSLPFNDTNRYLDNSVYHWIHRNYTSHCIDSTTSTSIYKCGPRRAAPTQDTVLTISALVSEIKWENRNTM